MHDNKTDASPPPFDEFVFTGQLMSDNPTNTTHSVITETQSQNPVPVDRSNDPFKPSMSPRSGYSNSPRSRTARFFDSEKVRSTIKS